MGGYYRAGGIGFGDGVLPTKDEASGTNFQKLGTFTIIGGTSILQTSVPHTQIAAEVVMFNSTVALPSPLEPFTLYRVLTDSLGASQMKVAPNEGWNPPPESSPINITDAGTGTHFMWIRPLEYIGPWAGIPSTNYMSTEYVGGSRGAVYWGQPPRGSNVGLRFQVKDEPSTPTTHIAPFLVNTDYFTGAYQRPPANPLSRWTGGVTGISNSGGQLWSYSDGTQIQLGLGDLGVIVAGALEAYYLISGDTIVIPGGGGGGDAAGGGEPLMVELPRPTIKVRDPELASIIRRARRASRTIEDLTIVGASGDSESGFSLND